LFAASAFALINLWAVVDLGYDNHARGRQIITGCVNVNW